MKRIDQLPEVRPLGKRGGDLPDRRVIEPLDPDAVAERLGEPFRLERTAAYLAALWESRELSPQGLSDFLSDAHDLARFAALAAGSQTGRYSRRFEAKVPSSTAFTRFLGRSLGIRFMGTRTGINRHGVRIDTYFGDGPWGGLTIMGYDILGPVSTISDKLAEVTLYDDYDEAEWINVKGLGALVQGEGDIAQVPGALEALGEDAQLIAKAMVEECVQRP